MNLIRNFTRPTECLLHSINKLRPSSYHSSNIASTKIDLNNNELNLIKSKLITNLRLSNEQANFVLLKCYNTEARFETENLVEQKIKLVDSNFQHNDICHNLEFLSMPFNELQNKINILTELGFENLELKLLNVLPLLMSKTVAELKKQQLYPKNKNPCSSIVEALKSKQLISSSCDKIYETESVLLVNVDSYNLSELRSKCLSHILRKLLDCSGQVAAHIVENFNCQHNFDKISFINLITILDIFINEINLPINKLIKNFSFFVNYKPENLFKLTNIKLFKENSNLRHIFFTRQRLLQIPANEIKERVDLLMNKYKCTSQQILNCITILELTPTQVNDYFGKFKECDSLKVYANNQHLLRLIMNIDLVLSNVGKVPDRSISSKYITLHSLLKSNANFANMVKNNTFQLTLNSFTQLHFDSPLKDIKTRIGWNKMGSRSLNSVNAENIITFFRNENLSDLQIANGIYLIYCQFETVTSVWEEMIQTEQVQKSNIDWRNHPYVLQLLYYFIEKAHRL